MKKTLNNQKGIALLVALFAVMLMTFLAMEIGYNTHVELAVSSAQIDRLRAFYLAKTGVNLSLLRIHLYKAALQKFGSQLGPNKGMLDMIWQFPFSWPPALPGDASSVDKDAINKIVKDSFIDGGFATSIQAEGGKIDLVDLTSPAKNLREAANAQLVKLIQDRLDMDDDWARDHRNLKPQELVNNITDWMDEDGDSLNGGDERSRYSNTDPPITPPNKPMKTIAELHMVAGITDEIYNLIAPRVTIYGDKGINVNTASKEVLKSIDKQITDDIADAIITRRSDPQKGPFQSPDDFNNFLSEASRGAINPKTFNQNPPIVLIFDPEHNFRIKSTGIYNRSQREIVAIVYDFDKVKERLSAQLAAQQQQQQQQGQPPGTNPPATNPPAGQQPPKGTPPPAPAKGPPQIVFWQEF